jgi:hypothetical protein
VIGEALDALWTLILAGGAWLLGMVLVVALALHTIGVCLWLATRTLWQAARGACAALSRPETTPDDSSVTPDPHSRAQRPSWARHEEAT